MTAYTSTGPLTAVGGALPRVQIVHPGALAPTTYNTASSTSSANVISPGDLVFQTVEAQSKSYYTQGGKVQKVASIPSFASGAMRSQYSVALSPVQVMTTEAAADASSGPMELVNADYANGDFVRLAAGDSTIATTVVKPDDAFLPGDLVCYDPAATRPSGYTGVGAWKKTTDQTVAIGQVVSFRAVGTNDGGILYVRLMLA